MTLFGSLNFVANQGFTQLARRAHQSVWIVLIVTHVSLNAKDNQVSWNELEYFDTYVIWLGFFVVIFAHRMLTVYPQTKIYFSEWTNVRYGSGRVKAHGKKVMGGIATAVANIDDLICGLQQLSKLHASTLKVDPANFRVNY